MNNIVRPAVGFDRGLVAQTGHIPDDKCFLQDTYPLEVRECKQVMSESKGGKPKKCLRITGIFQKAGTINQNGREYPLDIMSEAVEAIQPDLKNRSVMGQYDHPCLTTSDFRVLTTDGWKEFKDVKIGDYVWSRVDGKAVVSRVNAITDEPYDGDAYQFKGRFINTTFTPGHRMLLEKRNGKQIYRTAEDVFINRNRHHKIPKTAEWDIESPLFITIPGVSADELNISVNRFKNDITKDLHIETSVFSAFMGIYLSEGNTTNNYGIFINQKCDDGRNMIMDMLNRLPNELEWHEEENGFYLSDIRLHRYLKQLGNKYNKYIPSEIKNLGPDHLSELIHWFCIGDGRMVGYNRDGYSSWSDGPAKYNGGGAATATKPYVRSEVFSVSKQLIWDLHECLVKSGGCGTLSKIVTEDYEFDRHIIEAKNKRPLYQLHIAKFRNICMSEFLKINKVHHTGHIYCLSVDHRNLYIEHNGKSFWTGNSDAKIHLDRVSHLITKLWMEGDYVYGEAEVISGTDQGKNLTALLEAGVRIGISSRGVGDMEVVNEGMEDEKYIVQPGYRFVTFDVVGEPSIEEAVMSVMESRNKKRGIVTRSKLYKSNPELAAINEMRKFLNLEK